MKPSDGSGLRPALIAFSIWFAHFMLCWAAVEIWPQAWPANALAWGFTAIALLALGVEWLRLNRRTGRGELPDPARRLARGAIAIATVAVSLTAFPSVVLLP
jgi:hypothetical protein